MTPRSQAYPDTPPVLGADLFDTAPFSVRTAAEHSAQSLIISSFQASFSAFLKISAQDDSLQIPAVTADIPPDSVTDPKRLSNRAEASYYVEV